MTTPIQKDIEALKLIVEREQYREAEVPTLALYRLLAHVEALEKGCGAQAQVIKEALEWLDARDADIARAVLWRNKPSEGREG